jgi:DnaJ-class molecular chaperone
MMDAYRKAAIATHPDRGGSAMEFKLVQQAKETLLQKFDQQT